MNNDFYSRTAARPDVDRRRTRAEPNHEGPAMKWTRRRQTSSRRNSEPEWVDAVAERAAAALGAQLPAAATRWTAAAELRGYVRARAAATVREQMAAADADSPLSLSTEVWNAVIERTVHMVLHRQWIDVPVSRSQRSAA
jgi:hypothetical protein